MEWSDLQSWVGLAVILGVAVTLWSALSRRHSSKTGLRLQRRPQVREFEVRFNEACAPLAQRGFVPPMTHPELAALDDVVYEAKDWGAARWAEPIFSIMCDSSAAAVDHQLEQLLPPGPHGLKRYYRFQVRLDTGSDDMDDASSTNLRVLKLLGQDMLLRNRSRLRILAQHQAEYAELG